MINISRFIQKTYELQQQIQQPIQKSTPPAFQLVFSGIENAAELPKTPPGALGTQFTFRNASGNTPIHCLTKQENKCELVESNQFKQGFGDNASPSLSRFALYSDNLLQKEKDNFQCINEQDQDHRSSSKITVENDLAIKLGQQDRYSSTSLNKAEKSCEKLRSKYEINYDFDEQSHQISNLISQSELPTQNSIFNIHTNNNNNYNNFNKEACSELIWKSNMESSINMKGDNNNNNLNAQKQNNRYQTHASNASIIEDEQDVVILENNEDDHFIDNQSIRISQAIDQNIKITESLQKSNQTFTNKTHSIQTSNKTQDFIQMSNKTYLQTSNKIDDTILQSCQKDFIVKNMESIQLSSTIQPLALNALLIAETSPIELKEESMNVYFDSNRSSVKQEYPLVKPFLCETKSKDIPHFTKFDLDSKSPAIKDSGIDRQCRDLHQQFTNFQFPQDNQLNTRESMNYQYKRTGQESNIQCIKQQEQARNINQINDYIQNQIIESKAAPFKINVDLSSYCRMNKSENSNEKVQKNNNNENNNTHNESRINTTYQNYTENCAIHFGSQSFFDGNKNNLKSNTLSKIITPILNQISASKKKGELLSLDNKYLNTDATQCNISTPNKNQISKICCFDPSITIPMQQKLFHSITNHKDQKSPIRSHQNRGSHKESNSSVVIQSSQKKRERVLSLNLSALLSPQSSSSPFNNPQKQDKSDHLNNSNNKNQSTPKPFREQRNSSSQNSNYQYNDTKISPLSKRSQGDCQKFYPIASSKNSLNKFNSIATPKCQIKGKENQQQNINKFEPIFNNNYSQPPKKLSKQSSSSQLNNNSSTFNNNSSFFHTKEINYAKQAAQVQVPPTPLAPQQKFYKSNSKNNYEFNTVVINDTLSTDRKQSSHRSSSSSSSNLNNHSFLQQLICPHKMNQMYCNKCCRKSRSQIEQQLQMME